MEKTPTNLYEFYTGQGKSLPSIADRQNSAKEAGIQNYAGTAEQNTQLLSYLKQSKTVPSATGTIPIPTYGSEVKDNAGKVVGQAKFDPNTGLPLTAPTEPTTPTTPTPTPDANAGKSPNELALQDAETKKRLKDEQIEKEAEVASQKILDIQNGVIPLTQGEQAQIDGLKKQFDDLISEQRLVNTGASGMANVRGYQTGSAEYDPNFQVKTIGAIVTAGMSKVADLQIKQASAIALLTQSLKDNNISAIKSAYNILNTARENAQKALKETVDVVQKKIEEARKAKEEAEKRYYEEVEKPINEVMKDAAKNGATPEQLNAIYGSNSVAEAIANAGDSLVTGTGVIGEYLYYKKEALKNGQNPMDFNSYADMDANRKRPVTNIIGGGYGGYDKTQSTAIDQINSTISNSPTYKKYTTMQTFAENVNAGLSAGNGVGDIAAINQFQKVIDEGAVTRDQDVKLIQGAQSLSNQLKTKIKKLQKGEQLSADQRTQMMTLTNQMLDAQKKALEKDASITAQKKKAERYGINPEDTIISELGGSTADKLIQAEKQAEEKYISVAKSRPEVKKLTSDMETKLGRPINASEFFQMYPSYNN